MRELAGYDPARAREVLRWPIGEALAAYERLLREDARRSYEFRLLLWTIAAQAMGRKKSKKAPELPAILRDISE